MEIRTLKPLSPHQIQVLRIAAEHGAVTPFTRVGISAPSRHRHASSRQVSAGRRTIQRLLHDGRLRQKGGAVMALECEITHAGRVALRRATLEDL